MQEQETKAVQKHESAEKHKQLKAKSKKAQVEQKVAQQQSEAWKPEVGDLVEVPKLGGVARVQSVQGRRVTVSMGSMPITVKLPDVLRV